MTDKLARMQTDLTEAVAAKGKPFEHAAELAEKSARLEQLNRELEVGKAKDVIMNDDDEQEHDAPAQTEEITKSAPKQKRWFSRKSGICKSAVWKYGGFAFLLKKLLSYDIIHMEIYRANLLDKS